MSGTHSCTGIIPRFDLKLAKALLRKGKPQSEVIAAAVRLGDRQLKCNIERFIELHLQANLGENNAFMVVQRREITGGRKPFRVEKMRK